LEDGLTLPQGSQKGQRTEGHGREKTPALLMVGTVHRDPQGRCRLLRFLRREQPGIVSVEISPYARFFRARKAAGFRATLRENLRRIHREEGVSWQALLSHGAIQGVFLMLKEPYEWQAARAYAEETGKRVQDIDLSEFSEKRLSYLPETVSRENLRTLLALSFPSLPEQVKGHYKRARFLFSHPPSVWVKGLEMRERESIMAEKIRSLVLQAEGKKVVHIGGWEHLLEYSGEPSLYGLLKDFRPRRVLLSDMES
jgi:hypothetical protein